MNTPHSPKPTAPAANDMDDAEEMPRLRRKGIYILPNLFTLASTRS